MLRGGMKWYCTGLPRAFAHLGFAALTYLSDCDTRSPWQEVLPM